MATYKLIQDIEAEDHILGPLTLRQFIYSLVAVFFFYLSFIVITKHVAFLLVLFLPPALFCSFLAFPFKRDQPTEVWALAKVRFLLKPRKRIWSQSGIKNLVSITAPKHVETHLTNGLSQTEVANRLQALALTIDSRGWAVKNTNTIPPSYLSSQSDERLIDAGYLPKPVPDYETSPADDMLDETSNPIAIQVNDLINESSRQQRQKLIDSLNTIRKTEENKDSDEWFSQNEDKLSSSLKKINSAANLSTANLHALQTTPQNPSTQTSLSPTRPKPKVSTAQATPKPTNQQQPQAPAKETTSSNPDIINLSQRDDLNIATLQREAEVIVKLH